MVHAQSPTQILALDEISWRIWAYIPHLSTGEKKTMETKAEKAENYFLSKRQIKERIYVW